MDYRNLSLEELLNYTYDRESWYFIGMAYWKQHDFAKAIEWLEKTRTDTGNKWAGNATFNLAQFYTMGAMANKKDNPDEYNHSIEKALSLYDEMLSKKPKSSMATIHAGLLYYREKKEYAKGKKMIVDGIAFLKEEDGDDSYLKPDECFKIGVMFVREENSKEAIEYLTKTRDRCDIRYSSDRELREMAVSCLQDLGVS